MQTNNLTTDHPIIEPLHIFVGRFYWTLNLDIGKFHFNTQCTDAKQFNNSKLLNPCIPCLLDPGEARGCSTNTSVINSFINLVPTALRRRHAQAVRDSSLSYKIDYVIAIKILLDPEGHQNGITGSKVPAILVKG